MKFRPFRFTPFHRLPVKFLIPNLATAANMMLGLGSVWYALRGDVEMAAWLIVWAAFTDGLDGLLARLLDARSHFGIEFDSLADIISFGLAPATVLASYADRVGMGVWDGSAGGWLVLAPCTFYVVMAGVRLARYNVQTLELGELLFRGVPTTMAAGLISVAVLSLIKHGDPVVDREALLLLVGGLAVGFGLLMVSNLPLPKFRKRKVKILSITQSVLAGVLIVLSFLRRMPEVMLIAGSLYLLGGFVVGARYERGFRREQKRRQLMAREAERVLERLSDVDEAEEESSTNTATSTVELP